MLMLHIDTSIESVLRRYFSSSKYVAVSIVYIDSAPLNYSMVHSQSNIRCCSLTQCALDFASCRDAAAALGQQPWGVCNVISDGRTSPKWACPCRDMGGAPEHACKRPEHDASACAPAERRSTPPPPECRTTYACPPQTPIAPQSLHDTHILLHSACTHTITH